MTSLPVSVLLREHLTSAFPCLTPVDLCTAVDEGFGLSERDAAARRFVSPGAIHARRLRVRARLGASGSTTAVQAVLLGSVLQRLQWSPGAPSSANAAAPGNASGEGATR